MVADPTKSELEILQVLWEKGPSSVREVTDELNNKIREVQYASILKLMQIMTEKQILARDETNIKHIYRAILEEDSTKKDLLTKFVDTIYKGSASSLMMQLIGSNKADKKELDAIKEILKNL
jgi:BlaI family penicillinase repressor